jgi:hypothetical protein
MILMRKLGRKQAKSVLVARLRLFSDADCHQNHVLWIGEKCPISLSQNLENQTVSIAFAS